MRTLTQALFALFLAGCSLGVGGGSGPPTATIDNVAGKAVSYCWGTQCVDGFPTADGPMVRTAGGLRFEQTPTELQVFVRSGSAQNFKQEPVAVTNRQLGPLPDGDWDYLLAMAHFSSGSAMYAWRLK